MGVWLSLLPSLLPERLLVTERLGVWQQVCMCVCVCICGTCVTACVCIQIGTGVCGSVSCELGTEDVSLTCVWAQVQVQIQGHLLAMSVLVQDLH